MGERSAQLRSILHAAAQVLRCGSVTLARLSEDHKSLVFAVAANAQAAPGLEEVETALGFEISGLDMPLSVTESVLVRAFREERLIVSHDVTEITADYLPLEVARRIGEIIGPRTFGLAPVLGRGGALGVLLVEKPGQDGLSSEERGLLLVYAEQVGAELESDALQDEASRLLQIGQVPPPPPSLFLCSERDGALFCDGDRPFHAALGLADPAALWNADVQCRLIAGETVTVQAGTLRVTLRPAPPGLVCAVEDLSWNERLRREMLLAREHLSKVMRSVEDALLTVDAALVIRQASDASRTVLGAEPAQLVGRSALSLALTAAGKGQLLHLQERLLKSGFAERQLRLQRIDGKRFPAQVSALLLGDEEGRPAGAVWRIHDQTERRRGDAERRRLRLRLLSAERLSALGEMAARIAHEVRNPLVSIGAAAQVVAEELPADSPVRGEALAIGNEVRRLDGIISDFLLFARPRRKKAVACDVHEALREVLDLIRPKVGGLVFLLAPPGSDGLRALIDPDGLKQVLWNLLLNACEASRPAARVECGARRGAERVLVSVADRGAGIPRALRRRVFDPFFSTKARGTGLGLSICKQIVEEHGGRIRLLNRHDGGTRVVVELRPAPAAALLETVTP